MERIIKFRVWHKDEKRWLDQYLEEDPMINLEGVVLMFERPPVDAWTNKEYINGNLIIQQFTGLLDKNGKEIYEGDILSGYDPEDNPSMKSEIKFGEYLDENYLKCYGYYVNWGSKESWDLCQYNENSYIIGNIFENPSLLN